MIEVRDARKEMNMVQTEIVHLTSVLQILAQDMKDYPETMFPAVLVDDIKSIITDCEAALNQVEQCIAAHTNDKTTKSMKWALFGRENMLKYKSLLNAYQRALNMAIETLNLYVAFAFVALQTRDLMTSQIDQQRYQKRHSTATR